ncbi:T9SS type A sorting domain-containing protein, partial [Candidatus Kapabacteria bacterium]|nr:T9SS type A sorting domain-containing protein [Candidatus Kapabacteria bacterium]
NGFNGSVGTTISLSNNRGGNFSSFASSRNFNEYSQWIAPFELDPNNTSTLYMGFNNIYRVNDMLGNPSTSKLTNNQVSNGNTIRQIAISPKNSNNIWYSIFGTVYYSNDGGNNWNIAYNGNRVITDIEPSQNVASEAYITITGFTGGLKVIKLSGTNSENISYNLPNIAALSIVQIPNTNELYVGMDIGVYKKSNNGSSWELFNKGLTYSGISELEFQKSSQLLRASTYGRGIWEVELIDCEIVRPELSSEGPTDLCEGEEVELSYSGDYDRVVWNTGSLKRKITVSEPGEYFVTAENDDGCFSISETIEVKYFDNPVAKLTKEGIVNVCRGDSVRVTVQGFFDEYEWSDGTTDRNLWVKEEGEYFLTVRDGDALCEGISNVITVNIVETPDIPTVDIVDNVLIVNTSENIIQWYFEGEEIEGANGLEYTPETSGDFYVTVSNGNDCIIASEIVKVTWFSVTEGNKRGFKVTPNPTDGKIEINYNGLSAGNTRLEIIDNLGQVILTDEFYSNGSHFNQTFDLTNQSKGIYFVSLWNNGIRVSKKIIIK